MRTHYKLCLCSILTVLLFSATACRVPPPPLPPHPSRVISQLHRYHYFPGSQVYYYPGRRIYFYHDHGTWISAPVLPPYIHIDLNNFYGIELEGPKPYIHHRDIVRRYPPGLRKEKHRRQREKIEIKKERKREKVETRQKRRKEKKEDERRYKKDRRHEDKSKKDRKKRGHDDDDDDDGRNWKRKDEKKKHGKSKKDDRPRGKKAGITVMNPSDREQIKAQIISEISKVKEDVISLKEQAGPVAPDNAIGRLSRMEAMSSRGISEAKLRDARGRLIMLENAMGKIDNPEFGLCRECGDPIQIARLKLLPETTLCIDCAEEK